MSKTKIFITLHNGTNDCSPRCMCHIAIEEWGCRPSNFNFKKKSENISGLLAIFKKADIYCDGGGTLP